MLRFLWHFSKNPIKTSWAIKYLTIGLTQKWCIWKRCSPTRRITSRSPIYGATKIERIAAETVWKKHVFRTFCDAMRRAFGRAQIGDWEQKVHMDLHLFCIYHFSVRPVFKFLIVPEILACHRGLAAATRPHSPPQLRIWILDVPKSDIYKKDANLCVLSAPDLRSVLGRMLVALHCKTCEKRVFFTQFPQLFAQFLSCRKSETEGWFYASESIFFIYITFVLDQWANT